MDSFIQPAGGKKLPHNLAHAVELTNTVVEFVARDLRPVSVVDGCGFLNLMNVAEPCFVVMCRQTVTNLIDRKYCELKCSIRGSLVDSGG